MSPAEIAALQAANAAGGGSYLAAVNAQNKTAQGLASSPTSTQYGLGADAIALVQKDYPNLAWLLTIPGLGSQIVSWAQQGLDPSAAEAEFESTPWYQQNSDATRKWIAEQAQDPAQATADLAAQESAMSATLTNLGLTGTPDQVKALATASLAQGWTSQQTKDNISQSIVAGPNGTFSFHYDNQVGGTSAGGGTLVSTLQGIQSEAAKYLVPISDGTAQSFATAMANGTMDSSAVTAYMVTHAESLYPSIAGAIKAGITPADYVSPYKQVAAQLLGVDANSIDMTQPQYMRAITAPDPKTGIPSAMSLYTWQQTLMQDPQYNYTQSTNAKDRASSIAQGIAEMFGKTASGPTGSTAFNAAGAPRIAGAPVQ